MGMCHLDRKEKQAAIAEFLKAIELDDSPAVFHQHLKDAQSLK
jgi:hypothetical protein